jgi:predicted dehydrogenase
MVKRRHFLVSAAAAASQSWAQANDRVRVAIIGVGSRGSAHIKEMPEGANIDADMRRIFDDKEIDAVTIATTNHWHTLTAIWAMQAGKDVYVEKPVSHNVWEGTKLVEAARKYKRIAAGGTQRRWWGRFRKAIEVVHSGAIGDIYQGNFFFPGSRDSIGFKENKPVPGWLNWDLWVGPAPMQPYHENLVHYNWHWFWDFGNGELGNNGIHLVDILRWGMKKRLPVSIESSGGRFGYKDQAQTPNTQNITWTYGDGTMILGQLRGLYTAEPMSWDFFGTKGHMHVMADGRFRIRLGRNKELEPDTTTYPADENHFQSFANAVRKRDPKLLSAEIEETFLSTSLCHLGNISYRVGRKLKFDEESMQFPGDAEANQLLTREYRKPYVVPERV